MYESQPNRSFLTPFFWNSFHTLDAQISPLVEQTRSLQSNGPGRSDRQRQRIVELLVNSSAVRLFTEAQAPKSAVWVLFRDSFVFLTMAKTRFFDYAWGTDPFESVRDLFEAATGSTGQNDEADSRMLKTLDPETPRPAKSDLRNRRPGLLYVVELVAFNLMSRMDPESPLTSADAMFQVYADFIIWAKRSRDSLDALARLMQYVPVHAGLFGELGAFLGELEIGELFFTGGGLQRALLGFFMSQMDKVFGGLSVDNSFGLAQELLRILDANSGPSQQPPALLFPQGAAERVWNKADVEGVLKLKDFFVSIQGRVFREDLGTLQQLPLRPTPELCSAFFLAEHDRQGGELYWDAFVEENKMVATVDLINQRAHLFKMNVFARVAEDDQILEIKPARPEGQAAPRHTGTAGEGRDHNALKRAYERNCTILEEDSVYRRLRLVVQMGGPLHQSKSFQRLLEFLYRHLIDWVMQRPRVRLGPLERHFHLLLGDCANLNIMVNILLEATTGLGPRAEQVLAWVSRSPNERFLQILIDKSSQLLSSRSREAERTDSVFSRQRMLGLLDMGESSRVRVILRLVERYDRMLASGHSRLDSVELDLLMTLFHLRSELQALVNDTSREETHDLLELGSHLISEDGCAGDSRVRNSVLIYVLGSLQKKFDFLGDPKSAFRPLLPQSVVFSQSQSLHVFQDSLRDHPCHAAPTVLAKLELLLQQPTPTDAEGLSRLGFYHLGLGLANLRHTLALVATQHAPLLDRLKARSSPLQSAFLEAVLEDFPRHEGLSLRSECEQWHPGLLLLVLNVTLAAVSSDRGEWFLPRLLDDLCAGQNRRIPFNFKNVLVFDQKLNLAINAKGNTPRLYECVHCRTPFSTGNCGNLVQFLAKCVGCKREIGGVAYNKPNDNTREISFEEYRRRLLLSPFYEIHEYLDAASCPEHLPPFGFRLGHLLTHCLYAGLALTGLADCGALLLENIRVSHPHLQVGSEESLSYFLRHVQNDLDWLKQRLRLNESPFDFAGFVLQDILAASPQTLRVEAGGHPAPGEDNRGNAPQPSQTTQPEELRAVEKGFAVFVERYRARLAEIQLEVKAQRNQARVQEAVSEDAIRRNIDFEEVRDDVDRFLFLHLRDSADLTLDTLRGELGTRQDDFPTLRFYLTHHVDSRPG